MNDKYRKIVQYVFNAYGTDYLLNGWNNDSVCVEEARKNGQEDTHFYAGFDRIDGKWHPDEAMREDAAGEEAWEYFKCNLEEAQHIADFFNEHGLPDEDNINESS